eukprot:13802238-Alexandrium_andersonii.AAC.1
MVVAAARPAAASFGAGADGRAPGGADPRPELELVELRVLGEEAPDEDASEDVAADAAERADRGELAGSSSAASTAASSSSGASRASPAGALSGRASSGIGAAGSASSGRPVGVRSESDAESRHEWAGLSASGPGNSGAR